MRINWKLNIRLPGDEISGILWNFKVRYAVPKSPQVFIMSQPVAPPLHPIRLAQNQLHKTGRFKKLTVAKLETEIVHVSWEPKFQYLFSAGTTAIPDTNLINCSSRCCASRPFQVYW